jgi:hypothetical protein
MAHGREGHRGDDERFAVPGHCNHKWAFLFKLCKGVDAKILEPKGVRKA